MTNETNSGETSSGGPNAGEKNIDPRFDPAFQRGFEGAVGTTRRRPSVGSPSVLPAQQPSQRPGSRPALPSYAPQPSAVDAADSRPEADTREPTRYERDGLDDHNDSDERTGRNPFVIALVVAAVALVAIGLWAAQFARTVYQSNSLSSTIDFVTVQMIMYAATIAVGLGVAVGLGIVFLYASRWQRGRGRIPKDD